MLYVLLCVHLFGQVWSKDLPPPKDVHIDSLLRWTPAPEHRNVNYTVQYRSFNTIEWYDVPACSNTQLNSCDVTSLKAELKAKAKAEADPNPEPGCVELRVRGQKHDLTSRWVEACSTWGDFCSPEVTLTARPESLTVNLSSNHSMALKHAAHAKQQIYIGREGEPLQKYEEVISSVTIRDLEEGARYCVKVQFTLYEIPVGPPSCTQCEVIPQSSTKATQAKVIAAVVTVVILFFVLPAISYVIIFQREKIKRWIQPPFPTPPKCIEPFGEHLLVSLNPPPEERYDEITYISRGEVL